MEPSIRIRKLFALRIQTNCSQECVILLEHNNTNNARDKSSIIHDANLRTYYIHTYTYL